MILYNFGVPRLCGNQRSGTLSGILKFTDTKVGEVVSAGSDSKESWGDVILSSGMEIVMNGDLMATADRRARVTLTTQSAASFGRAIGVCPTFEISSDDSSMKIGLLEETSKGCETGLAEATSLSDKVTK